MLDGVPPKTNYGGPTLLSALVPRPLIHPGTLVVYLVDGLDESNRAEIVVEPCRA
jgi:hypothetical protein